MECVDACSSSESEGSTVAAPKVRRTLLWVLDWESLRGTWVACTCMIALWDAPFVLAILGWIALGRQACFCEAERRAIWRGALNMVHFFPVIAATGLLVAMSDILVRYTTATISMPGDARLRWSLLCIPAVTTLLAWWIGIRSDRTGRLMTRRNRGHFGPAAM